MNLIIRQAKVIDPKSPYHNEIADLKIEGGVITKIGKKLQNPDKLKEVTFQGLHISQGWFDSSVSLGEPGFEDRETLSNGLDTAGKSGFTAIALQPNAFPIPDSQSGISFSKRKAEACTYI